MGKAFFKTIREDRSGQAVIEFALVTTLIFTAFTAVLDFAFLRIQQRQMSEALSSAAASAFLNRSAVNFSAIPAYVQATADLQAATVTVKCNGNATCANSNRTCACLSATGTYTSVSSCGVTCSGSTATSGYYMTIAGTMPYATVLVPERYLAGKAVNRSITVRLQ